jgi:hypothetical protein
MMGWLWGSYSTVVLAIPTIESRCGLAFRLILVTTPTTQTHSAGDLNDGALPVLAGADEFHVASFRARDLCHSVALSLLGLGHHEREMPAQAMVRDRRDGVTDRVRLAKFVLDWTKGDCCGIA